MPPDADEWAVVERRGPHLLESGRPFVVHGFYTYWLNVCRTWAFNDGGSRPLQLKPFSYDEEVFQVSLVGCFGWARHDACLMKCVAECHVRSDQIVC